MFTSKQTIPFLQRLFSFGWAKRRLIPKKTAVEPESTESEETDEVHSVTADANASLPEEPAEEPAEEPMREEQPEEEPAFDTEAELRKAEAQQAEAERRQQAAFEVTIAKEPDFVEEIVEEEPKANPNAGFTVEVPQGDDEYDASLRGGAFGLVDRVLWGLSLIHI